MARSLITSAGLALCWILSPDALIMFTKSAGRSGEMFFAPLVIGVLLSALAVHYIHHPAIATSSNNSFTKLAGETAPLPAMTAIIAGRLSPVLMLPTGMLVTSGYTFNETFVYWFPNFAFSFLLLGFILALHLAGKQFAIATQPFFIGLTICCLVVLCLAGLFSDQLLQPIEDQPESNPVSYLSQIFMVLLLFLGYDIFDIRTISAQRNSLFYTLLIGLTILLPWGFVCLKHLPKIILAESTIPNIIVAREILGQSGRIIMGLAIISGTCGMVNGLFLLAGHSMQQVANYILGDSIEKSVLSERIWPVIFTLAIGIFLALGLAGTEKLETFIFGALLLWLLLIGMYFFAAVKSLYTQKLTTKFGYLLSTVFPVAVVWLAWLHTHVATLVVFCLIVLVASAICSFCLIHFVRRRGQQDNS